MRVLNNQQAQNRLKGHQTKKRKQLVLYSTLQPASVSCLQFAHAREGAKFRKRSKNRLRSANKTTAHVGATQRGPK